MQEHHLEVRRTARYYTLGNSEAPEVWIACHGYAQLARYFLRPFSAIDDGSRFIVAPEALNLYYSESAPGVHAADARVGATWMTREHRAAEISDYVAYLDALADRVAAGRRIVALGFSQGSATVSRWAVLGRTHIDHVVLWGTGPAHDLQIDAARLNRSRVTLVAGDADQYFDGAAAERASARLLESGVPSDVLRHEGGHRITPEALAKLVVL
jgi:predicted esterase